MMWEMAVKKRFVDRDVLVGVNRLSRFKIHHSVNCSKEGIAMRQVIADLMNIH